MRPAGVGLGADYAEMADLDRSKARRRLLRACPRRAALGQGRAVGGLVECSCSGGRFSLFLWSLCWRPKMISRQALWRSGCALVLAGSLLGALYAQRPFREYPSIEYGETVPLPRDWNRPGEWVFARLMYPQGPVDGYRYDTGDWRQGLSLWTQDYPRADRAFAQAVKRLTRVDARSVEEAVNLDDGDEVYNWPWLYAVQVGGWGLTERQAKKLRDYLLRGGFFMADDFHGSEEQAYFEKTMKMVFPDRPIVDIPNDDPIFHTVFDLNDRYRITGA